MPKKRKPKPRPGETPRLSSVYSGKEEDGESFVTVDGVPLNPRNDLANHSPDGFSWGYGGSGPAQLALAILADFLGDDERALSLYQDFKFDRVTTIRQGSSWTLTGQEIADSKTLKSEIVRKIHER